MSDQAPQDQAASAESPSLLAPPQAEDEKRGVIGTPSAERRRNAELRRQQEAERRAREEAERQARAAEEKRRLQEKIRAAKEEAQRKKEEQERILAEQRVVQEEERRRREEELASSLALAKEEAQRKKEEQERVLAEQRAAKEEAQRRREEELATSKLRAKEEAQRKKEHEQAEAQARAAELEERRRREEEGLRRHREEAARQRSETERAAAEEKQRKDDERRRVEEESRALIQRTAEEAKRKKEELKLQQEAEALRQQEERERLVEERRKRREEELEATRIEKKRLEDEARRVAEEKKEALRLQHQQAVQKHAEEVKRQQELEKDLEQEERAKAEALRAQQFAEEQRRRQEELEQLIDEEKQRTAELAVKMKELGIGPQQGVVNRIGLFREFGEEPGLEIWSVGDEQIMKLPKLKHELRGIINESHGSFHVAKCYIILHTSFAKGRRNFWIHSWTGSKSSELFREQVEKRLTELEQGLIFENILGVTREVELEESEQVRSYFPEGIEYVQPVALRETEGPNSVEKRLYHIKGRNHVHVRRVKAEPASLNSGDVFVLETQKYIFQWNGAKSNQMEKGKALDLCVQLRIERNARPRVLVLDTREESHELNLFWEALTADANGEGGVRAVQAVKDPEAGGDDTEYEVSLMQSFKLYRVAPTGDESKSTLELISEGREPRVESLERSCCFVLDAVSEIYVWYGSQSAVELRDEALACARQLGSEDGRDESAREPFVVRERSETILFKEKFVGSWGEYADFDFSSKAPAGNIASMVQEEVNIDEMHHPERYELAKEETRRAVIPPKDLRARTELEVWLVGRHDKTALDRAEYGCFFTAHCYLIMFTVYLHDGDTRNAIYYWQGRDSTREDRGTSALIAGEIGTKLRFATVLRVVQNKEPQEFIEHFGKSLLVLRGDRTDTIGARLVHVRGNTETTTYGIETGRTVSSLNSNDAFVLLRGAGQQPFVWRGCGSNVYEYDSAVAIATRYSGIDSSAGLIDLAEGSESDDFWAALDGDRHQSYSNAVHLARATAGISCRMFTCSTAIGVFRVTEVDQPVAQDDLTPRNAMILDGLQREVFVWFGPQATDACKEMALDTARKYIAFEAEHHTKYDDCVLHAPINAGDEPVEFRAYFHAWDAQLAEDTKDPYAGRLRALAVAQAKKETQN